jgi:hypothetical protein
VPCPTRLSTLSARRRLRPGTDRVRRGEAEGFELSEADLIPRRRAHTQPIRRDAAGFDEPEIPRLDDDRYGAGVDEDPET